MELADIEGTIMTALQSDSVLFATLAILLFIHFDIFHLDGIGGLANTAWAFSSSAVWAWNYFKA